MHFRVRGNNVQIVKTVFDKKTLKSSSQPAGSANIKTAVLSDELLSNLDEKEILEVRRWIDNRQRINSLKLEVDAHMLSSRIEDAATWLATANAAKATEIANEIQRAMAKLRLALKKRGLGAIRPAAKTEGRGS